MSKVSFRARALDSNKPLPLYYEEELPDLSEYVAINRTVPQMPTGMEKEEESESHLQKVINARQNLKDTSNLVIPIPEAAIPVSDHQTIYKKSRNQSNTYIRMPGLGPDEELPEYDLDSEDEEWLSVQSRERPLSPIHFERMMDRLEKGSGNTVLSDRDAQVLLKDDEDLVMAVYDYWLAKRLRLSRPLIPSVKNERREGTSSSNPYLAFRKRTEKMQTRKNRKNDEQAYMHMLKLKRDLTRSVTLIDLVKEREQRKYDNALIQAEIFRKRYLLEDWSGNLISSLKPHGAPTSTGRRLSTPDNKWDNKGMRTDYYDDNDGIIPLSNRTKKKRRKGPMYTPTMIDNESPLATVGLSKSDKEIKDIDKIDPNEERIDVEELDGPFTFRRKIHLHYHKSGPFNTLPWDSPPCGNDLEQSLPSKKARFCFSRTSLCGRRLGFSRRRTGRGGRSIWDFVPESYVQQESKDSLNITTNEIRDVDSDTLTPSCTTLELPLQPDSSDINKHQSRCPHFYPASPKSTSFVDFEFTYLPFVDPSSYSCPELHKGYSQFAGQTLNDDEEGVSSFSLLPTSQFTLRPCINPDQSNDPVSDNQVGENVDPLEEQSQSNHIHGDEVVWKKFRQFEPDSKTDPVSDQSSNSSTVKVTPLLTVPSTHLSSLESGLPIQIHVDNLMHLPKKDQKVTIPNTLSLNKTLSSSSSSHPSPSLNSVPSTNITANTDTGVTPGQSLVKPQPNKDVVTWFKDCPSSNILLLNNCSRQSNSGFSRFRCALPPSIAKSITTRFKTDAKSDPLSSVVTTVSHPLSSSLLPHSLLPSQHQIVNSLISDPKKLESFVKDKRQIVTHPGNHHQNSSPNGTAKLELNHTGKLSLDANKDIKHTLAARSVMNNHSSLIEGSSGNVLVKLSSGTSPSEVT